MIRQDFWAGTEGGNAEYSMEEDDIVAENYLRSSKFRASGFGRFMQDIVAMRRDRVVAVPDGIDDYVAAFLPNWYP